MKGNPWSRLLAAAMLLAAMATTAGAAELKFQKIVIDRGNSEGCSVVDVNGDGLLDIVRLPNWYRAPDWDERPLHDIRRSGEYVMNHGQIPMDVNGDGAVDIISSGWFDKEIYWYENPGGFKKKADEYKIWQMHVLAQPPRLGGGPESIVALDIDGDGRIDVVPNQRPIGWYRLEKSADGKPVFKRYPIDETGFKSGEWQHGIGYGDLNGDGRKDIVSNDVWFEAPADPLAGHWKAHRGEFFLHDASVPIIVDDFDGDGDNDFAWGRGHNFGVFWMEQTKGTGKARWRQHVIDKTWSQAHSLVWIDLDGDGRKELVTGKRWRGHNGDDPGADMPLGVYYYKPGPKALKWEKHVIIYGEHVGIGMQPTVVDIDKDGDLDIVCPGKSGLYLLKNATK